MTNIENTLTNEAIIQSDKKPAELERTCKDAVPKSRFNGKLLICKSEYPCAFSEQNGRHERRCTLYD